MDIDIYISAYYNVSMSSDEFIRKGLLPMKNHALPFTPIKTTNISKLVMESIKQALLRRSLQPGDRLPSETELCESLGVGKSSVREAIKMLEVLGVVETHQGEGTYISEKIPENSLNPLVFQLLIDYGNHADILELRRIFEPAYTKLAMENATEEDVQRLCLACERFESKISQGCQEAEDDLAFHYAILEATKNPFVIRIGKTILQLFQASIGESMRTIPLQALSDHRRILQAFIKKDEQELICAVENSFQGWASVMAKEDCGPGHKKEDESI